MTPAEHDKNNTRPQTTREKQDNPWYGTRAHGNKHLNASIESKTAGWGELMGGVSSQKHASTSRFHLSLPRPPCVCTAFPGGTAAEVLVGDESIHRPGTYGADVDVQVGTLGSERVSD